MDRKRWAQVITVAVIVLGAVGTATEMFPMHVREWALWSASVVTAVAAALGFNTGAGGGGSDGERPLYQRRIL